MMQGFYRNYTKCKKVDKHSCFMLDCERLLLMFALRLFADSNIFQFEFSDIDNNIVVFRNFEIRKTRQYLTFIAHW